eukprot:2398026-Alexandrium_andersonii.AAC.1
MPVAGLWCFRWRSLHSLGVHAAVGRSEVDTPHVAGAEPRLFECSTEGADRPTSDVCLRGHVLFAVATPIDGSSM